MTVILFINTAAAFRTALVGLDASQTRDDDRRRAPPAPVAVPRFALLRRRSSWSSLPPPPITGRGARTHKSLPLSPPRPTPFRLNRISCRVFLKKSDDLDRKKKKRSENLPGKNRGTTITIISRRGFLYIVIWTFPALGTRVELTSKSSGLRAPDTEFYIRFQ